MAGKWWAVLAALMLAAACADTKPAGDGSIVRDVPMPVDLPDLAAVDSTCASATFEAKQTRAALMIVLDRSSSMVNDNKWQAAQLAIVRAIDTAAFDHLDLGLLAYPSIATPAPPCLFLTPTVSCGVTALPQVPIGDTGADKSSAPSGVRRAIYNWLNQNSPDNTLSDASPGYEALAGAISALQAHSINGKRLILFITDGGFSCASVSKPARPGYSDGLCPDWEYPATVISLLSQAQADASKPVSSFIIGVPGSNSNGGPNGFFATAPYSMRNALSAYAAAGSPATVSPGCDGRTFTHPGSEPQSPCHFDMTQPGGFDASKLAGILGQIRGQVLGCSYELPTPQGGGTVDRGKVNVQVSRKGEKPSVLPKRSDPNDGCQSNGCWDYDKDGKVVLVGKACDVVTQSSEIRVDILVGCQTVIK